MKRIRGFTLIELLATLAILAIIAAMAVPSFDRLITRTRIDGDLSMIRGAITFARGEAVNRQTTVSICSSTYDGSDGSPACDGTSDWSDGWIVFVDDDDDRVVDTDEELLRVWQGGISGNGSLEEVSASLTGTTFVQSGAISNEASTIKLTLNPSADCGDGDQRIIEVTTVGRMNITQGNCP